MELFWLSAADLARRSEEMLDAVDSRSLRWFVRATPGAAYRPVLVYLPRDRYTTASRLSLQDEIATGCRPPTSEYTARVSELPLALLLQIAGPVDDEAIAGPRFSRTRFDRPCRDPASPARPYPQLGRPGAGRRRRRRWPNCCGCRRRPLGADDGADTLLALVSALSEDYKESRTPEDAVVDLAHVVGLEPGGMTVTMRRCAADSARWTFTLYLCGKSVSLTDVPSGAAKPRRRRTRRTPVRTRPARRRAVLGLRVRGEPRAGDHHRSDSDEAGLTYGSPTRSRALWQGEAEVDAFNARSSCGADWTGGLWPSCVPATGT